MRASAISSLIATLAMATALQCPRPAPPNPYPCSAAFVATSPLVVETPRARMVFQYDAQTGTASIPVSGRYSGSPAAIEARRGGGDWILVDAHPSDGRYAGSLPDQPVGRATLEVRVVNDASTLISLADVGVGNVVVIAGQSNAQMWMGTRHQTVNEASALPDPSEHNPDDPNLVQWADDPIHSCFPLFGSVWPKLGDRLIAASSGIPLMFVATARNSTGLVDPPDWLPPDGPTFNGMISQIALATGGQRCPAAVLWFQGESDAGQQVSQSAYEDALVVFGDALQAALTCPNATPVPIVVGVIGAIDRATSEPGTITPAQVAEIQRAQRNAPSLRSYFRAGPDTEDFLRFPMSSLHFTDGAYAALLDTWCQSVAGVGGLACQP